MKNNRLTIIGAGPAGLAAAYYAKKAGLNFRLLESSGRVGGNAATLRHGDFLYDTGAHRWHDRLPEITADVKALLGDELVEIHVPSQIFSKGRYFDFPLSPLNLLKNLGPATMLKAGFELLRSKLNRAESGQDFGAQALRAYGPTIAKRFLLGYSEKLWGAPAESLSVEVAGKRLKGLNLKTFLLEAFKGNRTKTAHLDGLFYYPKFGIGTIAEKMAQNIGAENIQLQSRVQKIYHQQNKITKIELQTGEQQDVQQLVSTLPLSTLIRALNPPTPAHILSAADALQFRHLLLVVLFLNKESVSANASIYFPDPELPFTRLYEPRNRSSYMAPPGQTSAVIEIPAKPESELWQQTDKELADMVQVKLFAMNLIKPAEVIGCSVHRVPYAYPILLQDSVKHSRILLDYLATFPNLHLVGRTASFKYTHLHDHFMQAKELVAKFII